MSVVLQKRVAAALREREEAGLLRRTTVSERREGVLNLADNDYFRMSRRSEVIEAAAAALERHGCSASASPLVGGFGPAQEAFLSRVLAWHGYFYGMLWTSGYSANGAILSALPKPGDLVLADRLIHHSMISGILRSGARLLRYPHAEIDALESLLAKHCDENRQVFVVTESVFSMDGDYPDLSAIAVLKERYRFCWMLDEAHALGWFGERGSGLAERFQCAGQVDVLVGTLGKALGSSGAYSLFHDEALRDYVVNFSGEYIYSTGLSPAAAAAAGAAVRMLTENPGWRRQAQGISIEFRSRVAVLGLEVAKGDAPIVPLIIGDARTTLAAAAFLENEGILVGAIRNPTVPRDACRLRIGLRGDMSSVEIDRTVEALKRMKEALCL